MTFTYKTEVELSAMTPEQRDIYGTQKREFESKATEKMIQDALDKAFPTKYSEMKAKHPDKNESEIKALVAAEELAEKTARENTIKEIKELKETVAQLKEAGAGPASIKTVEEKLEAVIKTEREKINISLKNKGQEHEFVVKADTLRASVVGNANALDVPGIGQLAYRKLTVYDMFTKIPVGINMNGTVRYVDWDDATKVRAAAAIAEAGTFPESTAKWATYTLTLKKVGDSIPLSEEFAYDDAMFAAELADFLRTNVSIVIDTALINATGTGATILGMLAQVPAYTPVASGITDASIYDLIVTMKAAITAPYGSKYMPNVALMTTTDINKYKLKKDANHNYVMPPFVTRDGNTIDGILVLECNALTVDTMILGDSRFGKIYEEPGVYVATAYNGTDFIEDMMTMKARRRLNLLIRTVDQTGWLKLVGIDAALVTLAS